MNHHSQKNFEGFIESKWIKQNKNTLQLSPAQWTGLLFYGWEKG